MNKMLLVKHALFLFSLVFVITPAFSAEIADRVLVTKSEKKLYLIKNGIPYKEFSVALSPRPRGHKIEEGDEKTPEGSYILDYKNDESNFYKSIHISYPNQQDIQRAAATGVDPGGAIMIHGLPNDLAFSAEFIQVFNWTDGCIAVTNQDMDQIWLAVQPGTPIDILP